MAPIKFVLKREAITHRDGSPYLIRWHLVHSRWGRIYLHKFLASDEGCPHDHPWSFVSIMLRGSYLEMQYNGENGQLSGAKLYRAPFILRRRANWLHKVIINKPCWTLVITSTWKRKWGFFTKRGWVKHNDYTPTNICE